ncbi:hypothetical protein [Amycolatopsis sp. SID8362]|uniref:hypothetical protein n=1 Tax=Amycolatopsis sp. SID8362 TaxID=2690346 RepID=UPI00136E5D8D|nr:hypothetical protein [Amycolatopsis sp. SID8362]NBH09767.1 hypothetical protein [Amycolatopsis sp. SID8362]NED46460.1 hypothetical protein [Amycolatopsis sp. SID8362]
MSVRALPFLATGAVLLIAGCSGGGSTSAAPASSSAATASTSAAPSSAPATTELPPTTSVKKAAGAVERYETFLHAVGKQDLATACEIAAPAAKKAEDEGFGPCEQTFPITFSMFSAAQRKALLSATVDRGRISETSTKVEIPAKAVRSAAKFTDSDLGDAVLELRGGKWYVTD